MPTNEAKRDLDNPMNSDPTPFPEFEKVAAAPSSPVSESLRIQVASKIVGHIFNSPDGAVGPATLMTRERGLRIADEIIALLGHAQTPAARQMHSDLRRLAIKEQHRLDGGRTILAGYGCKVCEGEWGEHSPEFHARTCTAAPLSDTSTSRETLIGGTNFCGHGMMAAICPTCTDSSPDREPE